MNPLRGLRTILAAWPRGARRGRAARDCRRRPDVESLESRRLLTSTTFWSVATISTSRPTGLVAGPDGKVWIAEQGPDQIEVLDPAGGPVAGISLTAGVNPQGIAVGPDGKIWFTESSGHNGNGQIASVDPTTHAVTELPPLPNPGSFPAGIVAGPDGDVWFTEASIGPHKGQIGRVDPATGAVAEFPLPDPSGQAFRITAGPDGNLWFTERNLDRIGRIDPATGAISEYPIPTPGVGPMDIVAASDGNLWFMEAVANGVTGAWQLGMIDPATGHIQEFPVAGLEGPTSLAAGPDGNLWLTSEVAASGTSLGGDSLWEFNPVDHGADFTPILFGQRHSLGIAAGPGGNLWFAEALSPIAIEEVVLGRHLAIADPPPANVAPGVGFGLTVAVTYDSGAVDAGYDGPVTVALTDPDGATLGGPTTGTARDGVATFTGLSIDRAGQYRLMAYCAPFITTLSAPLTVAVPPPGTGGPAGTGGPTGDAAPRLVAERFLRADRRHHARVIGIELDFSAALDPTRAVASADYVLTQIAGRRRHRVARPVAFRASYDATAHRVALTFSGRPKFVGGGELVVVGAPGGLTDPAGAPLAGAALVIAPKGSAIAPSQAPASQG